MTLRLNDDEAAALIFRATADCANIVIDMRDAGASPADMMTTLTQINVAIMAYVLASAPNEGTASMIRHMSKALKERVPDVLAAYQAAIASGKEL